MLVLYYYVFTTLFFAWRTESFLVSNVISNALNTAPSPRVKTSDLHATWSNGQAVQDYQNFLATGRQEIELTSDGPSVIVVPSDSPLPLLASVWKDMGMGDDMLVEFDASATAALPAQMPDGRTEYPIYIFLPPNEITSFLMNLPDSYRERVDDFVFVAGGLAYGNNEDLLKDRGYCRDAMTQMVLSGLKVLPSGQVEDGKAYLGADASGEDKIAGECAACGKWAGSVVGRLERSNVYCSTGM